MLPLTVQFIHLFAANLMFKGMTPVPVILRMIYVNTRIEDFFHHFSRPIKSKTKTNRELLTLVFPRKEPATIALQFDRFM